MEKSEIMDYTFAKFAIVTQKDLKTEKIPEIYSDWVSHYEQGMLACDYDVPLHTAANKFSQIFPDKSLKVLDIGAGTGLLGQELKAVGFLNIDALDISEDMLKVAKEKSIYKNLIRDELGQNRLNIDDDTYDGITGCGIFLPGHVTESCFEELIRITKPGGYISILMGSKWLEPDQPLCGLEPKMAQFCEERKWKLLSKETGLSFTPATDAVYFLLQVN